MTLSGYLFTAIIRPKFSGPIGAAAVVALSWWAQAAYRLVQQIDAHTPSKMSLTEAVKASRDGEVYVAPTAATLDCDKSFRFGFGTAMALVDANGKVAAVGHFEACPADGRSLEGVFLDPPHGLYGEAVRLGWNVTEGHLAFFEPDPHASRAWTRIAIALAAVPLILACFWAGVRAEQRRGAQREAWRMRALGLGLMAGVTWFSYYAHAYVFFRVVPATVFVATGFAVALAFVLIPTSGYMRKVAQRVMPP
jgi:hypothetical protein